MIKTQTSVGFIVEPESFSTLVFGFLEEEELSEISFSYDKSENYMDDDADTDGDVRNFEEDKAFWELKDGLLQATLCGSSSTESKIQSATKEALKDRKQAGTGCSCPRQVADGCRDCLQRDISGKLRMAGFNCAICKSKWKRSQEIPSGEHTYLEVLDNSNTKKEIQVVIELNFRAEFEMARANDEYNKQINRLPEVFVGKAERLSALVKVLWSAAKKCMKDKKMHMSPWRKHKYMRSKWFNPCEKVGFPMT